MNILVVYPEFPDTFWSFKHALEFVGKRSALPPLGLLTVAAMLPREWSLRLVDTNVRGLTEKDLEWADCAFVSAMVVQRESARRIVAQCKAAGLRVIAGGPLFSSEHEQFAAVDHFILNEAELTLPPFLVDLARGHPQRIYSSVAFRLLDRVCGSRAVALLETASLDSVPPSPTASRCGHSRHLRLSLPQNLRKACCVKFERSEHDETTIREIEINECGGG